MNVKTSVRFQINLELDQSELYELYMSLRNFSTSSNDIIKKHIESMVSEKTLNAWNGIEDIK